MKKSIKKKIVLFTALVASIAMIGGTAMVSANNVTGYQNLKKAILAQKELENATINANAKFYVDGVEIVTIDTVSKYEEALKGSTITKINSSLIGVNKVTESYTTKDGSYSSMNDENTKFAYVPFSEFSYMQSSDNFEASENQVKFASAVLDLLTGDMKNYFTQNGNTIGLDLNSTQIPEVVQLAVAVVAEESAKSGDFNNHESSFVSSDVSDKMDVYMDTAVENFQNARIESVSGVINLSDDQQIIGCNGSVKVIGYDSNGTAHTAELFVDVSITDVGETVAEAFDPTGKEIENIMETFKYEIETMDNNGTIRTMPFTHTFGL